MSDYPRLTFSPRQYGDRAARPDAWYQHLVADLSGKPVVFVGTQLDEPPLWQHLALRGSRSRRSREQRPGSYLVTPNLSRGRQGTLQDLNIDWIPMGQEEFAETVLRPLETARLAGLDALEQQGRRQGQRTYYFVGQEDEDAPDDLAGFLLGRDPTWVDVTEGFAIQRTFEDELLERLAVEDPRVLVLTGTAGSGKSTTLRRIAVRLQAEGKTVLWVDPQTEVSIPQLRREVREASAEVIIVDDIDAFGRAAGPLLAELARDTPEALVIGGARSSKFERLELPRHLQGLSYLQFAVPHLEDGDIDSLLDALTEAGRLGRLAGQPRSAQHRAFRDVAGRQLIVAMIEATSGERFEDRLDRECRDLGPLVGQMYATVAIATSNREYVTRDEVLIAIGDSSNEALNHINDLITQRLVIVTNGLELRLRHRVVADQALDYFRSSHQLGQVLGGLLFAIATKVHPDHPRRSREWQLLIRLLNHDYLIRLAETASTIREAYESVESLLQWDYHYWLQRGSFEVEVGDIRLAQNFLEQARSGGGDDPHVQTEWSYMMMKRAHQDAANPSAPQWVSDALEELDDAIEQRGTTDSYPFHVLGSQGLGWSRRAPISDRGKLELLERIRATLATGRRLHPANGELKKLAEDVEAEYLYMAVPANERGHRPVG